MIVKNPDNSYEYVILYGSELALRANESYLQTKKAYSSVDNASRYPLYLMCSKSIYNIEDFMNTFLSKIDAKDKGIIFVEDKSITDKKLISFQRTFVDLFLFAIYSFSTNNIGLFYSILSRGKNLGFSGSFISYMNYDSGLELLSIYKQLNYHNISNLIRYRTECLLLLTDNIDDNLWQLFEPRIGNLLKKQVYNIQFYVPIPLRAICKLFSLFTWCQYTDNVEDYKIYQGLENIIKERYEEQFEDINAEITQIQIELRSKCKYKKRDNPIGYLDLISKELVNKVKSFQITKFNDTLELLESQQLDKLTRKIILNIRANVYENKYGLSDIQMKELENPLTLIRQVSQDNISELFELLELNLKLAVPYDKQLFYDINSLGASRVIGQLKQIGQTLNNSNKDKQLFILCNKIEQLLKGWSWISHDKGIYTEERMFHIHFFKAEGYESLKKRVDLIGIYDNFKIFILLKVLLKYKKNYYSDSVLVLETIGKLNLGLLEL